jgi:hypothetical protein
MSETKKKDGTPKTSKKNKWVEDTEVELAASPDLTVDAMIANASDSEMDRIAMGQNPRRVVKEEEGEVEDEEEASTE